MKKLYYVSVTVENSLAVPQTVKDRINLWPSNTTAGIYLKELKTDIQMKICVWVNVYSSSIPKSQKVEPTNERINKIWSVYTMGYYSAVKKGCSANTRYNVKLSKMLSRKSLTQKATYHVNLFVWHIQNRHILGTQGRLVAPSSWEEWGKEGDCLMATAFPLGVIKPGTK